MIEFLNHPKNYTNPQTTVISLRDMYVYCEERTIIQERYMYI